MSKHHHQSKAEQIYNKGREAERILKNKEMKKDFLLILAALFFMTTIWGCNMVKGAGQDMENAGGSIQKTVDKND